MEKDLVWIKKHYGETMMHMCRQFFPRILEVEGMLPNILEKSFAKSKTLAQDIIEEEKQLDFKKYIFSIADLHKVQKTPTQKSAAELMDEAGYILFPECKCNSDIQSFRKYWTEDEELCTFYGNRLSSCRVWFAIKKNIDQIKREDFVAPRREDEYGTSAISIQFSKGIINSCSIKNRYNHSVANPDNTFNNCLDNIAIGLTAAFEKDFNLTIMDEIDRHFYLNHYTKFDGKFYHYNYDLNDIFYCDDNVILTNRLVQLPKDNTMLVEYFVFDFKNKTIKLYDPELRDCFPSTFEDIQSMEYIQKERKIVVKGENEDITIVLDEHNNILSLQNNNLKECKNYFLNYDRTTQKLQMKNLEKCGDFFLHKNLKLEDVDLPKLKYCGDDFLSWSEGLKDINLPSLTACYDGFLSSCENITAASFPNLKSVGRGFMHYATKLKTISAPKLERCKDEFCARAENLEEFDLKSLNSCDSYFMEYCRKIEKINLPSLQKCGTFFMSNASGVKEVFLPNLEECGEGFLQFNKKANDLRAPKLEMCGKNFFEYNEDIINLTLEKLEFAGEGFFETNEKIRRVYLPNLTEIQQPKTSRFSLGGLISPHRLSNGQRRVQKLIADSIKKNKKTDDMQM